MRIALITGASAGLGRHFAALAGHYFPQVEAVWLIARRREKLEEVARSLGGMPAEIMALDLCDSASFAFLKEKLATERPEIVLLVNNAGCGYLGNVGEGDLSRQTRMVDLNVRALTAVTHLALPYMARGSRILNVSSISSFCPNPRLNTYSATKAYVTSFTRGLGFELRRRGITATAVCPGPMETDFLQTAGITGNSAAFDRLPRCHPEKVARGALAAARAGRAVYTPTAFYKFYRLLAKGLPQGLLLHLAKC